MKVAGGLAAAGAVAAGAWALTAGGGDGRAAPAVNETVATATTPVMRRDLVDTEDVSGSLDFAGTRTVGATVPGTITRLRAEGAIVRRGGSLFAIDAQATAYVLYGTVPMYRALGAGVPDGADVRQLERNLVALGHDPYGAVSVDGDWDAATTAAVERWQKARGVTADGSVGRGEVVFTNGPARVGEHAAAVGDAVRPGAAVTRITGLRRVVTARLDAARQSAVHRGDPVEVTLPDGRVIAGRVSSVGRVARPGEQEAPATVALHVRLRGHEGRRSDLDKAPVTVSITTQRTNDALSVPVTALVATAPGRYALELAGSGGRLRRVTLGAFAGGYVEVGGVEEGTRVVIPR